MEVCFLPTEMRTSGLLRIVKVCDAGERPLRDSQGEFLQSKKGIRPAFTLPARGPTLRQCLVTQPEGGWGMWFFGTVRPWAACSVPGLVREAVTCSRRLGRCHSG